MAGCWLRALEAWVNLPPALKDTSQSPRNQPRVPAPATALTSLTLHLFTLQPVIACAALFLIMAIQLCCMALIGPPAGVNRPPQVMLSDSCWLLLSPNFPAPLVSEGIAW